MIITLANVLYVLVAVAMIGFILVQRGPGADAGSGFGGGASATVFGARGSANFLSKSTAVLAILYFTLSLGMAVYARQTNMSVPVADDLGVMSGVGAAPADGETPGAPAIVPAAGDAGGNAEIPVAPVDAASTTGADAGAAVAEPAAANEAAANDAAANDDVPAATTSNEAAAEGEGK